MTPEALTWERLVEIEPRLVGLLAEAKAMPVTDPDYDELAAWYGWRNWPGLKPRLVQLVGWCAERQDPILTSTTAYDIAYRTIFDAMPFPRNHRSR